MLLPLMLDEYRKAGALCRTAWLPFKMLPSMQRNECAQFYTGLTQSHILQVRTLHAWKKAYQYIYLSLG